MNTVKDKPAIPFTSEMFWAMIEAQEHRCALTGRELTEMNTEVELKIPLKQSGKSVVSNLYCVDLQISRLARYLTEEQIIEVCIEVVRHRGKEKGYALRKIS